MRSNFSISEIVSTFGSLLGNFGDAIEAAGFVLIILLYDIYLKNPFIEAIFLVILEGLISFFAKYFV